MNDSPHIITLAAVKRKFPMLEPFSLGDEFIACELDGALVKGNRYVLGAIQDPIRIDAFLCVYCKEGDLQVEVNMRRFHLAKGSLLVSNPGNILRVVNVDEQNISGIDIVFILASISLMRNVRFELNPSFGTSVQIMEHPVITTNAAQREIARDYYQLIQKIMFSSLTDKFNVISTIIASLTYMTADVWSKQVSEAEAENKGGNNRLNALFSRFIELVSANYTEHRSVGYYAERLDLTPKYLSKLIKQASGMTAPEWINDFVVLEIKNILKYSDSSISDIVAQFHFSNPSAFYKFFKAQTGMTPVEYRKERMA